MTQELSSMKLSFVWAGHLRQVIIAGRAGAPDTEALLDAAHAPFVPDKARTACSQQRCLERAF